MIFEKTATEFLESVGALDKSALTEAHRLIHEEAEQKSPRWPRPEIVQAHDQIVARLEQSIPGWQHRTPLEIASGCDEGLAATSETIEASWPLDVEDYVCQLSSFDPNVCEVLVRADTITEALKNQIARHIGKYPDQIKWIADPKGPQGGYIPLFHRALLPVTQEQVSEANDLFINDKAVTHAKALIAQGKVNRAAPWSFGADDGNRILRLGNNSFENYSLFFLAKRRGANPKTRDAYAFPYGKMGMAYRQGVITAKKRAAQFGYSDIEKAADSLLQLIDKKSEK